MALDDFQSNIFVTLRGPDGDRHEAFMARATTFEEAIKSLGIFLANYPRRSEFTVVGVSWLLKGGPPLSDGTKKGGL
jgi:hypothetical protein